MTEFSPFQTDRVTLAAVVLTKNEARHITDCLATLGFADLIVVSDSYSTDSTAELAEAAGAVVLQRPFDNFAGQRNAAMAAVDAEWIFFVDADERITCLLYTSPSPRDGLLSRMPSSA